METLMWLCMLLAAALGAPPEKISVFVALPERDGFVDAGSGLTESQRDLMREINSRKTLRTARTKAEADIVLTVVARDVFSERDGGGVVMPLGPVTTIRPTYNTVMALRASMEVGDFTREIVGRFGYRSDVWQECAERVSMEVEGWAIANHDRLIARRGAR
jgi:hypothetical protein